MKLSISLTKKHVFLISLLALLVGIGIVYAYDTYNPPAMGHSSGEVDVVINSVTKTLQSAIDAGDFGGTITETDPQVGTLTSGKWCVADGAAVQCNQNPPSGGSKWTTSGSDIYYNLGKVGIRTETSLPEYKFHVTSADNGNPAARIENTNAGQGLAVSTTATSGKSIFNALSNSVSRFVVNADGNVGIGTTTPSTLLHVEEDGGASAAYIRNKGTGTIDNGLTIRVDGTNAVNHILNLQNGDNTRFYVRADGKVGIGTNNPQATLDVIGDVRIYGTTTVDIASSCSETSWGIIQRCQVPGGSSGKSLCTCARQGTGTWTWKFIHYPS